MVGKDAPEGAGTYFQRRPTVTQRAISIAVSMMVATTQRVPIWCLFMLVGCWLCWYLMYEVLAGCKEGTEGRTRLPAFVHPFVHRLLSLLRAWLLSTSVVSDKALWANTDST